MKFNKKSVLLAEDDEALASVMAHELSKAGFNVSRAKDGEEALKQAKKRPDLILLDLLLPKKVGFDVLRELKASMETRDIPVIVLSALGSDEDIKKGLELGAEDYVVKSQHALGEFVEKVEQFFAKHGS